MPVFCLLFLISLRIATGAGGIRLRTINLMAKVHLSNSQLAGWPNDDERVLNVMGQLKNSLGLQSSLPTLANVIDIYSD